jgi:hypothetical protein
VIHRSSEAFTDLLVVEILAVALVLTLVGEQHDPIGVDVLSASSIAAYGSASPVSPAAATPSSPRRSTLSRRTCSARAIASSTSDIQNFSALSARAGATTITSASDESPPDPSAPRSC